MNVIGAAVGGVHHQLTGEIPETTAQFLHRRVIKSAEVLEYFGGSGLGAAIRMPDRGQRPKLLFCLLCVASEQPFRFKQRDRKQGFSR